MMGKVKVAFYKAFQESADIKDLIIAKWTKGPYSHVELIIDGKMYSTSPRDNEVRVKKHKFDESKWDYIEIDNVDLKAIIKFFLMVKGSKYDWFGILGFVIPYQDRENLWFCSEFVSKALQLAGYEKLWKLDSSKISPNRLYNILTKKKDKK